MCYWSAWGSCRKHVEVLCIQENTGCLEETRGKRSRSINPLDLLGCKDSSLKRVLKQCQSFRLQLTTFLNRIRDNYMDSTYKRIGSAVRSLLYG